VLEGSIKVMTEEKITPEMKGIHLQIKMLPRLYMINDSSPRLSIMKFQNISKSEKLLKASIK
jgi:hypothetical protein